MIGGLIIGLMARFGSEKIRGHGIPEAIEAILFGESKLSLKVALLKPLSSAISIGSGGPFGAEGPIIMTGGAIGSLFAQLFHLSAAERKTLLVAGAAAGMTGDFRHAVRRDPAGGRAAAVRMEAAQLRAGRDGGARRARVAAVAGRRGPAVPVRARRRPRVSSLSRSPPASASSPGSLAALLSFLLYRIEDFFHRLPIHWMWWPAIGAVVVGVGGLIDPRVLGVGYDIIQALLDGDLVVQAVLLLLVVKAVVWLVALGSGTSGGVLAPLLILGGCAGLPDRPVPARATGFWAMIGMAGIMSGDDARAADRRAVRRRADQSPLGALPGRSPRARPPMPSAC